MIRFKKPVVALLSLCLVAGAACSSTPDTGSAPAAKGGKAVAKTFKPASSNTLNAESMRFSVTFGLPGLGSMSGEGFQDLKSGTMSMVMTMPSFAPGMPPFKMEQLLVGDAMYMRSDMFAGALPPGKSWMKLDLASLGEELGVDFAEIMEQGRESDPRGQLSFLQGTKGDIEDLGSAQIRGVKTTHYKFVVDVAAAARELPAELGDMKELIENVGVSEFPAEAWIDEEGLVRRVVYTMSVPVDETGTKTEAMNISMDFFDFGSSQDVSAPPAAQVVDFMEAVGSLS